MRLLLFLLLIPISSGLTIVDAEGDVVDSLGLGVPGPDDFLDILSLAVNEREGDLQFSLELGDYEPDSSTVFPQVSVQVGSSEFELEFRLGSGCGDIAAYQDDRLLACLPFETREPLSWVASRELLGFPPAGRELFISASTRSLFTPGLMDFTSASHFIDVAPDIGQASLIYVYNNGINLPGITIMAEESVQFSNGAQKWFLFQLNVTTFREIQIDYVAPENLVLMGPTIVGQGATAIPVFVRVPNHAAHGVQIPLKIVVENQTLSLGIQLEDFPNPSGHHQTLFLHSAKQPSSHEAALGAQQPIWMNALKEDLFSDTTDEPVEGRWRGTGVDPEPFSAMEWTIPLSPAPRLPMKFEDDMAKLRLNLEVAQDTSVALKVTVNHCPNGYATIQCLGGSEALFVASTSFEASSGQNQIEMELTQLVPSSIAGGTLELRLEANVLANAALPVGVIPRLFVSDSSITLPLLEVEKPEYAPSIAAPEFRLEGNPGDSIRVGPNQFEYIILEGPFTVNLGVMEIPIDHELGEFGILIAGVNPNGEYFISSEIVSVIPDEQKQIASFVERESPAMNFIFVAGLILLAFRLRKE